MSISIAMATYDGARFVDAQLASFAAQTLLPDEVVVTDDGSRDGTPEIVERFAARVPFPVRLERNPRNLGFARNFERALSLASGEVVLLSDQDDVWMPDKIARLAGALADDPSALAVMGDARLADGALRAGNRTKRGALREAGLPDEAFVMGCCAAVRRELVDLALPFPAEVRAHDNWLIGLADALDATRRLDDVLQLYRLHGGNTSDFHVNRVEAPGRAERLAAQLARLRRHLSGRDGLAAEHALADAVARRLEKRGHALPAGLAARRARLAARMNVRGASRVARPLRMAQGWRAGAYRPDLKGALKDLLAPGGVRA